MASNFLLLRQATHCKEEILERRLHVNASAAQASRWFPTDTSQQRNYNFVLLKVDNLRLCSRTASNTFHVVALQMGGKITTSIVSLISLAYVALVTRPQG